jgi:hypothetical protein
MTAKTITIAEIEKKIAAAREHLSSLDVEAKAISLPAVSGDRNAAEALANIHASIKQVTSDVTVLESARLIAARREVEAVAEADAEYRARHFEIARGHAGEIVKLASRADEFVASYKALIGALSEAERKIGSALHKAGERLNTTIVGRKDLVSFMIERMFAVSMGREKFLVEQRPIAKIAEHAWADLLAHKGAVDE